MHYFYYILIILIVYIIYRLRSRPRDHNATNACHLRTMISFWKIENRSKLGEDLGIDKLSIHFSGYNFMSYIMGLLMGILFKNLKSLYNYMAARTLYFDEFIVSGMVLGIGRWNRPMEKSMEKPPF